MAHRTFTGADGREWQVWNVVPGAWRQGWSGNELRTVDRRCPDPVLRYTGPERRVANRRTGSTAVAAPVVTGDLAAGWVTFESGTERRRLTPIPDGWEDLPEAELAALCDRAVPVPRRTRES
jgi:hypothetical protein